jgi:hypothetical protein
MGLWQREMPRMHEQEVLKAAALSLPQQPTVGNSITLMDTSALNNADDDTNLHSSSSSSSLSLSIHHQASNHHNNNQGALSVAQSTQCENNNSTAHSPSAIKPVNNNNVADVTNNVTGAGKNTGSGATNTKKKGNNTAGTATAHYLDRLQQIAISEELQPVQPLHITSDLYGWTKPTKFDLYADFETCTGLNDSFSSFPVSEDSTLVGVIGCLHFHPVTQQPVVRVYVCNELTLAEEKRIFEEWNRDTEQFMHEYGIELAPGERPRVYHYSHAEVTMLANAYNSTLKRHQAEYDWYTRYEWCDILKVIKQEPVVVRGAFSNGLKAIAKSLYLRGKISVTWPQAQIDSGLNAMVALFKIGAEAKRRGISMQQHPLMQQMIAYNTVDITAMHAVIEYLRDNHT